MCRPQKGGPRAWPLLPLCLSPWGLEALGSHVGSHLHLFPRAWGRGQWIRDGERRRAGFAWRPEEKLDPTSASLLVLLVSPEHAAEPLTDHFLRPAASPALGPLACFPCSFSSPRSTGGRTLLADATLSSSTG